MGTNWISDVIMTYPWAPGLLWNIFIQGFDTVSDRNHHDFTLSLLILTLEKYFHVTYMGYSQTTLTFQLKKRQGRIICVSDTYSSIFKIFAPEVSSRVEVSFRVRTRI